MHAGFGFGTSLPSSGQTNPFGYALSPSWYGPQQSLQAIPQQLNQLQQLAYIQQQQLQQVLQIVPAQLQQLQQVIQIVPQQLQQLLQLLAQQQFGSSHQGMGALTQPQGFASPCQAFAPYTTPFAGSGQVM
jgi:TolA-binding protein